MSVSRQYELVTVIIIHYGEKKLLKNCLPSISFQTYDNLEIIVINNSDYTINKSILKSLTGTVINNETNNFFSKSVNQGIRISGGKFILVLNNDVILDKNFISECIKAIKLDERIGMVNGKILDARGKRIDSTGQFLSKYRRPVDRGYKELDKGQFDKEGYVFGVSGMAAFYRKKMLEEVKINKEYFDEDYKMFYEDLDLNWRAQKCGWKAYYISKAIAYHTRGGSSRKVTRKNIFFNRFYFAHIPQDLKYHVIKNRYMTIIKNEDFKDFFLNLFWILIYDVVLWSFIIIYSPKLIYITLLNIKDFSKAIIKRKYIEKNLISFSYH